MESLRSFRITARQDQIPWVEALLRDEGFSFEEEPFADCARRLIREPFPLGASLAAFFGYIYIQDRSSMLPPLVLAPSRGASVLDICASPGSKAGLLAHLVGPEGFVLANEPAQDRLATLRANILRANLLQAATCSIAGEALPLSASTWPFILLDPPCSGWGTVAKNPKTVKFWQGDKIQALVHIQKRLLKKAASLLAKDGRLLYSTCTTNPAENEAQTAYASQELGLRPLPIAPIPGFTFTESRELGLTIKADANSQGFYLSLLTKAHGQPEACENFKLSSLLMAQELGGPTVEPTLLPPGETGVFNKTVRFLPKLAFHLPAALRWQGFPLGTWHDRFKPEARLRVLLPPLDHSAPRIIYEEMEPIRKLLAGVSIATDIKAPTAGLWWKELPLGIVQVKNGRLIASFRH